jgi:hypothetical protein
MYRFIYICNHKHTLSVMGSWNPRFWLVQTSTNQNWVLSLKFWKNSLFVISAKFHVLCIIWNFWCPEICTTSDTLITLIFTIHCGWKPNILKILHNNKEIQTLFGGMKIKIISWNYQVSVFLGLAGLLNLF